MKRLLDQIETTTRSSRRRFLLAGAAVVTTLHTGRTGTSCPKETSEERDMIFEIMERYGSELGHARYVEGE
jgi:hypothetical protein